MAHGLEAYCADVQYRVIDSMKKANAWSLALIPCLGLWLGAAPVWGATAPALSEVRVFKVESAKCTETIPERTSTTQMCTHRGPTKVSVMEVGLGNNPVGLLQRRGAQWPAHAGVPGRQRQRGLHWRGHLDGLHLCV